MRSALILGLSVILCASANAATAHHRCCDMEPRIGGFKRRKSSCAMPSLTHSRAYDSISVKEILDRIDARKSCPVTRARRSSKSNARKKWRCVLHI